MTRQISAFFYGTLMHPAILKRVLGNDASHLQAAPAILMSYTRHHVTGCDYPAIIPYNLGSTLLGRELSRDEKCVRGVIVSGLTSADISHLDLFEGDDYDRIEVEAHPITQLAPISPSLTQVLLSASSELPAELLPALKVHTYVWVHGTALLDPIIWQYDTFVKEKLWRWAGVGANSNEYYQEIDEKHSMNGTTVVPVGGGGELVPDYTFGHPMLDHFMFEEGYVNLNQGSYGSLPKQVFDRCIELSKRIEGNPDAFHRKKYQSELREARTRLAKLLNCEPDECVITNNTTHGIHTILNNFHWKSGDILVSFSTTYGAVFNMLDYLADTPPHPEHINIPLAFPISHKELLSIFRQQLKRTTRHQGQTIVAVIDAIASNPGVLFPWEEMIKICKEEGVYSLIDGAHAIGQIDLDLASSQPDFFISNCHKWLYAKRAAAVMYIPKRNQHLIQSTFPTSHAYVSPRSGKEPDLIGQFEWTGTIDFVPFLSINYALDFRKAIGGEKKIHDYCHSLALKGGAIMAEILGTQVMETGEQELTANMVNVQLPLTVPGGTPQDELQSVYRLINDRLLDEYNVYAAIYVHDNRWWTRCSAEIWNEESDFIYLARAFSKICQDIQKQPEEPSTVQGSKKFTNGNVGGTSL